MSIETEAIRVAAVAAALVEDCQRAASPRGRPGQGPSARKWWDSGEMVLGMIRDERRRQGEHLGIGLSGSLRELSSKLLESQRDRAETIARQAAVKILAPLVLFIFPAVFLIILSPVLFGLRQMIRG